METGFSVKVAFLGRPPNKELYSLFVSFYSVLEDSTGSSFLPNNPPPIEGAADAADVELPLPKLLNKPWEDEDLGGSA